VNRLVIPHQVFDALARGGGGPEAGRLLTSAARGRHLLLLKAVADEAGIPSVRDSFEALARMHEAAPDRVDRVLGYPAVGAWALATVRGLREGEGAHPERMAAVAAVAALRAGRPLEAEVRVDDGGVMLPSLGRALVGEPPGRRRCLLTVHPAKTSVSCGGSLVELPADPGRDADGWQGLRTITAEHPEGALRLVIDDLDPHRFAPGVPLAPRLSAAEVARWQALLQEAWTILRRHHREVAEEIHAMISVMVPLSTTTGSPAGGTSRTTFGCVALARPADALSLAAVLAHEVQHAKLTELFHLADLVSLDPGERYYAPWREDPRPITGLLHGTYAHLGVAAFWRRQRHLYGDDAAHAEFVRWRDAAAETAQVISDSSALTPVGRRFLDGMLATLRAFQAEPVPVRAAELARGAAERHRRGFDSRSGKCRPR
jgi:HEXXH motif-containing protein